LASLWQDRLELAGAVLMAYDIALLIPSEIALVWRRKWGFPTVLYLITRYGVLLQSIIAFAFPAMLGSSSEASSNGNFWSTSGSYSVPITILLSEALLTLRVAILWKETRLAIVFLWTTYSLCAVTSLAIGVLRTVFSMQIAISLATGGSVEGFASKMDFVGKLFTLWIPGLVMETTLVIAMAIKAHESRKDHITKLFRTLFRDGFLYFLCVFALIMVNLVICVSNPAQPDVDWLLVEPSLCLIALLAGRLFLNLRATAYAEEYDSNETSRWPEDAGATTRVAQWDWDVDPASREQQPETEGEHAVHVWHG